MADQLGRITSWWKIVLAAGVIGAAIGLGVSVAIPKTFEATATLLVGPQIGAAPLDYDAILAAQLQAETFAGIGAARSTLTTTIARTGLDITANDLMNQIEVEVPASSRFVTITVPDASPYRAAQVANAVAGTLLVAATGQSGEAMLRGLEQDLERIYEQAAEVAAELDSVETSPMADQERIEGLNVRADELSRQQDEVLQRIAAVGAEPLTLVDPATPPDTPSSPRPFINAALAAVAAMVGIVAWALLTSSGSAVHPPTSFPDRAGASRTRRAG